MTHLVEILERIQGFIELGGDVLLVIFIVTLLLWTLIIERLVYFRLGHAAAGKRTLERWRARADRSSWYAREIRRLEISRIAQRLNRSLPMIRTLVALCPLLGLLGTVTGMIEVFDVMALVGTGNTRAMASGVSMATVPTMSGMVVALSGLYFSVRLGRTARHKTGQLGESMLLEESMEVEDAQIEESMNLTRGEPCAAD